MPDGAKRRLPVIPAEYQPSLPLDQLILAEPPQEEAVEMDVLFVGGGPAALAGAIELARLVKEDVEQGGSLGAIEIGVLEKADALGEHCLSGAVVNPRAFRELFPGMPDSEFPFRGRVEHERVLLLTEAGSVRLPTPPTMRNHGNYIASLCEIVRWLGERAEAAGVNVFTGFPAGALLVDDTLVKGVRTTPTGLDREGNPGAGYMPATDVTARVTVLAEGSRGMLAQAFYQWQAIPSQNPQIFALGVKEIWETRRPLEGIIHTMGWPIPNDGFGGSFMYPLEPNVVALGLVVGLDYKQLDLDVHDLLQRMKLHPVFRPYLEGGEMVEWGAKTIPEGGYYAVPQRRHGNGVLVVGDSAGFVEVASLKGIHYAMHSGMCAARAIFGALKQGDTSAQGLKSYDRMMNDSFVMRELHARRNMRLAFKDGFWIGGAKAALMSLTGGAFPGGRIPMEPDARVPRVDGGRPALTADGTLTFRKLDAVFKSGNATRDDIPSHLIVGKDIPPELAEFYQHMCPAGVYEREGEALVVNAPNCVDCKATDDLGPRWTPREGGSGPRYRRM